MTIEQDLSRIAEQEKALSFDAFDLLYDGRGLAADEVAHALVDLAERTLLAGA